MRFNLVADPPSQEERPWRRTFVWLPHFTSNGKHLVWLEWCETKRFYDEEIGLWVNIYRLWDGKEVDEHTVL